MTRFNPRTYVEGMEALGYTVAAMRGGRWYFGMPGIRVSPKFYALQAALNAPDAADANRRSVEAFLITTGRFDGALKEKSQSERGSKAV